MKKNTLLLAAVGGMLFSANEAMAQDATAIVVEETTVEAVDCKDHYSPGSWRDNWYIQFGAGIQSPFVENSRAKGDDSR